MKKVFRLLIVAAALPLTPAVAQSTTTKGTRVLGVSANDMYYSSDDFRSRLEISLTPSIGKFFADNWAYGLMTPIRYSRYKFKSTVNKGHELFIGLTPWLRYYVPSESRHRVFAQVQAGILANKYRGTRSYYDGIDTIVRTSGNTEVGYLAGLGAGYTYFVTPNIGLEALVSYQRGGFTGGDRGAVALDLGLRAYLGQ
ncbi:hypothetical protein KLP40_07840 [Hymenobacter sp. NST-14]|uniref:hypothetical protein n=1 Tax=Hymenobacter piscis TaxID=2839984 RepID=UPI001C03771B|nr:hypothetical protein [Hymenobacter piscis]MBT9393071.1 hypothetical protein [Hymenobacter piscis]